LARIRFHLDEHIPRGVAEALRRHGVDAETSTDAGLLGALDVEHLAHGQKQGRMIVTQDDDYLRLDGRGLSHNGIAYCSHDPRFFGHIGHLVEALLLIYEIYEAEEMVGRVEYI
jgi:hypothetical protein